MLKRAATFVLCGGLAALGSAGAATRTATLAAAGDTFIQNGPPNANQAQTNPLSLEGENKARVLIQFNQAQIASAQGSDRFVSAVLRLYVESNNGKWGSGQTVDLHRVDRAWTEAGATWRCPIDTVPGNNQTDCATQWDGGSFVSPATATLTHTNSTAGFVDFNVTADVGVFLAGTANDGWLVKHRDHKAKGKVGYTARNGPAGRTPQLVLTFDVTPDTVAPSLTFTEPFVPILRDERNPLVVVTYEDTASGVDPATFRLRVAGTDVTGSCTPAAASARCTLPSLSSATDGISEHRFDAEVKDRAGNRATASLTVLLILGQGDTQAPRVLLSAPADGLLTQQTAVDVNGMVLDDGVVGRLTVNDVETPLSAGTFTAQVPLAEGVNDITADALDGAGRHGVARVTVTLDTKPPALAVEAPVDGQITNAASIGLAGTASDAGGLARVTVNGTTLTLTGGAFAVDVPLAEGANSLVVEAVDRAGNATTKTLAVRRFSLPRVAITSPADLSSTTEAQVTVVGTVTGAGSRVVVNGVTASVAGGGFTAPGVAVGAGPNVITAVATDAAGHVNTDTITLVRDNIPPRLGIYVPADGASTADDAVTVQGWVSDQAEGALDVEAPQVTVAGVPAVVGNETFLVRGVPLAPGSNALEVIATDRAGNVARKTVTVKRETPRRRVRIVSGDGQTATLGTRLPDPLVVEVLDEAGLPVAGKPVLFSVRGNDGALDDGERQVAVATNAQGQAGAFLTLGHRAGAGIQRVEALVAGYGGAAVFTATVLPGEPSLIVVDAGDQQRGVAGQKLPRPLVSVVTDAGFNRLAGVPVRFRVIAGGGSFVGGETELVDETDSLGRVTLPFTLGPAEGVAGNVVKAVIDGLSGGPLASFTATGLTAGDPAATSISGIVLDNANRPVPGVTLRILDTAITTQADAGGVFRIAPAPVGTVKLIVDGSTAGRPGSWPDLEFVLTTIPGRENTVGMPIFLLPLDLASGIAVDETHGGTITVPGFPGFALDVEPGSVTFPTGSRSGLVSVTLVHADKVPMVPNFGQQPRFIVTIQPAGAHFDPPARMTLPNVDGLPPGAVTEMYSFDHDLVRFVSIGLATVSEDGLKVVSNPGAGVRKAGWHCGGSPSGSGTTHDCPTCRKCVNDFCEADDGQTPQQNAPDDCKKEICMGGGPKSIPDTGERPPEVRENCADEICTGAGPDKRTNLSDAPAGQQCCDTGSGSGGTPFDPMTKCCEAPKLLNKHPIANLADCPRRTRYPPHVPSANGCGSPTSSVPVPQNPNVTCFGPSFVPACDVHDRCYDMCGNDKGVCDRQFLTDLLAICRGANILCLGTCERNALIYYEAVNWGGGTAYEEAQKNACQCCP